MRPHWEHKKIKPTHSSVFLNLRLITDDEFFNPDYSTCVTIVWAQIIGSQRAPGQAGVQTITTFNEPSITFLPLVGGHKEPGQDCVAGCSTSRPHGGGEGPAAGQWLYRNEG